MFTEKSIQEIEKATGLKGLQEMHDSKEPVDIVPKYTIHMNQVSYDTMVQNLTKDIDPEKYSEIKAIGEEMAIKGIKKEFGYEFEGKSAKALHDFLKKQIQISTEQNESEKVKLLTEEKEQLKATILKKEKELSEVAGKRKIDKIDSTIKSYFKSLNIDVPLHIKDEKEIAKYIQTEQDKNEAYFRTLYQFDLDDKENIISLQNGQILKDEVLSPLTVDKLFNGFISESFVSLKKQGGRGEGDKLPSYSMPKIQSLDELDTYATSKGVKKGSEAYDALYVEYMKTQKT